MFDYETLKLIWWVLVGVLLIGFAITDGFDMGAAVLIPFAGKTDLERRQIINAFAPHWEGNQVWLVTAGGAIFAAWPMVYATAFSGFYWAMLITLFTLFLRPTGLDYRSKIDNPRWRKMWDIGLFIGSLVPPVIFGVAFGNLLQGVPFHLDSDLRSFYDGSFWQLLNPFGLLAGVISLLMIVTHGGNWLGAKSSGVIRERARVYAILSALATAVLFLLAGYWVAHLPGFEITQSGDVNTALNPLHKTVVIGSHDLLTNFSTYSLMKWAPILGVAGALFSALAQYKHRAGWAFLASSVMIAGIITTAGFALFPFIMPSSTMPASSLTLWDAVSSQKTLGIMAIVAFILVPIVLSYTLWAYIKMWRQVSAEEIAKNPVSFY